MALCWASGLGHCSPKQSGEHYVTRGLWSSDTITISGFDWQQGQSNRISLANLQTKILCSVHNNQLSDVDAEAARIFKIIGEISQTLQQWAKNPPKKRPASPKRYNADGKLFERWVAKTLIDFFCVEIKKDKRWHAVGTHPLEPPIEVLNAIYGNTQFTHRWACI